MNRLLRKSCLALSLVALLSASRAWADHGSSRQFYGGWQKHSSGFAHRPYYFKPSPTYSGFKHHHVILHPKHPNHLYFYNPQKKQFWGRCPVNAGGKEAYSLLAEKDRSGDLAKIPEKAFPKPGEMPPIPESTDGEKLDLPPDDLPDLSDLPK